MNKLPYKLLFLIGCFLMIAQTSYSQQQILFAIDMQQEIASGEFQPADDAVYLTGNQAPLSDINSIKMEDSSPVDSIYVANVDFPPSANGKTLKYNFVIVKDGDRKQEDRPRVLKIQGNQANRRLDLAYFNSFAQ